MSQKFAIVSCNEMQRNNFDFFNFLLDLVTLLLAKSFKYIFVNKLIFSHV